MGTRLNSKKAMKMRTHKTLNSTQALKTWIKDLLGQARKTVELDSPKVKIFLQVYTTTHKRAVRILKLPKNLF